LTNTIAVKIAQPYSVEPNPKQPIDREQAGSTRALAAKNLPLMTEGKVL
jgi:hypothetical protein